MTDRPTGDTPPIRIDLEQGWAWCGKRRLDLAPRLFALLRHFAEHPQRLLTKEDLFAAVWGDTVVSDAALTSCIRDLRRALGDTSRAPWYIATVHRRGFRFVGPVADGANSTVTPVPAVMTPAVEACVGRDVELARLRALLDDARSGRRQLVFVTGEAGIGKTTVVEAFLATLPAEELRIARGQCIEHYGAGEAYLPVLAALSRLGRETDGPALVQTLTRYAPTWLAQLPALLDDETLDVVQRRAHGTTHERMLREMCEALEAFTADVPLVLVLEDLHWTDAATVELVAMIARRRDPARLLVVGTVRPGEIAAATHPLAGVLRELEVHGQCVVMPLLAFDGAAVAAYLAHRCPSAQLPPALAPRLLESTGGNALFLVNVVDDLVARGELACTRGTWELGVSVDRVVRDVPRSLAGLLSSQIERLTPVEQTILSIGSVAGADFSTALAPVDGLDVGEAERRCDALARRGVLLRAVGVESWPDGTVAGRYAFVHALYRDVLYDRIPIGHRVGLHLRIAARLEAAHGARAAEVASALAVHFEAGRDVERAIRHRHVAADTALRRHAHRQAIHHVTTGLRLAATLPASTARAQLEVGLHTIHAAAVIATNGWADPTVAEAYGQAHTLCAQLGLMPQLFPVLLGLCGFHLMRGELGIARDAAAQLLALANATDDGAIRLGAHNTAGLVAFYGGDFVDALAHFERAAAIYDPTQHSPNRLRAFSIDHDPGVSCAAHTAWTLSILGFPDRAAARMGECLRSARAIDHPLTLVMADNFAATFYQDRGDVARLREVVTEQSAVATEHGFELFVRLAAVYDGWLHAEAGRGEEALAQIRDGLAVYRFVGAALGTPTFLGILASVAATLGQRQVALDATGEGVALGQQTGLRYWDAELHRLQGEFLTAPGARRGRPGSSDETAAEASFLKALEIARRQQARTFELRTATSLARLWQRQGKKPEARALVRGVYERFSEGFETRDLRAARAIVTPGRES